MRIQSTKCKFLLNSVEYLGQVVIAQVIDTSERKVEAHIKMLPATNHQSLQSLMGIVNQYGKFIPFLANLSAPLNSLPNDPAQSLNNFNRSYSWELILSNPLTGYQSSNLIPGNNGITETTTQTCN